MLHGLVWAEREIHERGSSDEEQRRKVTMMQGNDRASLSSSKMIVSSMESGSKLHGHLQILHEGPWLRDNKKVRKKVKLYDFK